MYANGALEVNLLDVSAAAGGALLTPVYQTFDVLMGAGAQLALEFTSSVPGGSDQATVAAIQIYDMCACLSMHVSEFRV